MNIEVLRPYALFLIPLVIIGLIYSKRISRIKNSFTQNKYVVYRSIVLCLLILAFSGISIKWSSKMTTTVFLVDASDSVKDQQDHINEFIKAAIDGMPKENQTGIIAFGKDAKVDQFVTDKKIFQQVESEPISTATNLENAISKALALFNDNSAKRIVLITDGAQNEGEIGNLTSSLQTQNIDFKVYKLDQSIGEEVYVDNLTIPGRINVGDNFKVEVSVISNVTTKADVYLYSDNKLKEQIRVSLQKGENRFVFQDKQGDGGLKTYKVKVEADIDSNGQNNEYSAFADVKAAPNILLVEGQSDNGVVLENILTSLSIPYTKVTPKAVPNNISEMNRYKSIILVDVYAKDLRKGFLENLDSYVKDYAGGLIAAGGENSFALGDYKDTALEEVLPVEMDLQGEKEIPKTAIAMVIDHSGSMAAMDQNQASACDLAKQAAIEGIENLRQTDEIGVLAFDDQFDWVVELQSAGDKDEIADAIASIQPGGGTSIYPAIREAVTQIKKSDAKIKHIILLTDGQDGFRKYNDLLEELRKEEITLSTVAVGKESDQNTLAALAAGGNGRYYYTDIDSGIPRIFAKEIFLSTKSYLIQEDFTPVIVNSNSIINDVIKDGLPKMHGYIAATAKPIATTLLESHLGDPILTIWQYQLGRTVAWNTDATNQWTSNYADFEPYVELWKNLIDYTVSETGAGEDYLLVAQEGNTAKIEYTTKDYSERTKIVAVGITESGKQDNIQLKPTAPGKYEAKINLDEVGVYSINLRKQIGDTIVKSINTAAVVQYSPEYRYQIEESILTNFVEQVDGTFIRQESEIFQVPKEKLFASYDISELLLLIVLAFFMLDVTSRRLNLHFMEDLIGVCKKKPAKAETGKKEKIVKEKIIKERPVVTKEKKKQQEGIDTSSLLQKKKERE